MLGPCCGTDSLFRFNSHLNDLSAFLYEQYRQQIKLHRCLYLNSNETL